MIIKWQIKLSRYDENGDKISDDNQLTVTQDMAKQTQPITLICTATNGFNGETFTASDNFTFTVGKVALNGY